MVMTLLYMLKPSSVGKSMRSRMQLRPEKYEMEFTHRTIIRSLFTETDKDDVPNYCVISQINHVTWSTERYGKLLLF